MPIENHNVIPEDLKGNFKVAHASEPRHQLRMKASPEFDGHRATRATIIKASLHFVFDFAIANRALQARLLLRSKPYVCALRANASDRGARRTSGT